MDSHQRTLGLFGARQRIEVVLGVELALGAFPCVDLIEDLGQWRDHLVAERVDEKTHVLALGSLVLECQDIDGSPDSNYVAVYLVYLHESQLQQIGAVDQEVEVDLGWQLLHRRNLF